MYNKNPKQALTVSKNNSTYYEILAKRVGVKKADLEWKRRYYTTQNIFYISESECRDIEDKCDKFLAKHQLSFIGGWR